MWHEAAVDQTSDFGVESGYGESVREIARTFNVSHSTISRLTAPM
jgi:hypothetical protein